MVRSLLTAASVAAVIVVSTVLAIGPRPVAPCRMAGWTGYVPLVEGSTGASVAYEVARARWIPQCGPLVTGH